MNTPAEASHLAPRSSRKTALITGASSGIGHAFTRLFAQDGHDLVLVARSREALLYLAGTLRERYGIEVTVIVKDLSKPAAPAELVAELQAQGIPIDVLVNNAGFGFYGRFAQTDLAVELEMMQLNMVCLTHLTKLLLPAMLERGQGKILNVASTAGFQPGPLMAVYYATKAYVLSFSEVLANEVRGLGVSVTTLCPGPTPSGFQQRAGAGQSRFFKGRLMDAETVARIGYRALWRNQSLVIPGWRNWWLVFALRLLPRQLVVQLVRRIQEGRTHSAAPSPGTGAG